MGQMERDMAKRQQAMEAIERDVSNVNMIYKELNTLVYQQADIVDNIENHIDTADVEVQDGVHQLSQAATHAVSYRRKKFCLFMFCVAAILNVWFQLMVCNEMSRIHFSKIVKKNLSIYKVI